MPVRKYLSVISMMKGLKGDALYHSLETALELAFFEKYHGLITEEEYSSLLDLRRELLGVEV